jgi:hypothetical protein
MFEGCFLKIHHKCIFIRIDRNRSAAMRLTTFCDCVLRVLKTSRQHYSDRVRAKLLTVCMPIERGLPVSMGAPSGQAESLQQHGMTAN